MALSVLQTVTRLLASLLHVLIPVVGTAANLLRIKPRCGCCIATTQHANGYYTRSTRKKKSRPFSDSDIPNGLTEQTGSDVKRIKLLLDITVSEEGTQVLDIKARTRSDENEKYGKTCQVCIGGCEKNQWPIVKLLNLPSSLLLYVAEKAWQYAQALDAVLEEEPIPVKSSDGDTTRIKKSPKRRISRTHYRKILPFFPFNLLGFSNYSAFQLPTISQSSEEGNGLNASTNGKARCKRRRHSSTEDDLCSLSSLSDNDKEASSNQQPVVNGHDEVDSDETGDTVTKQVSSSSSSSGLNSKKFVIVSNTEADICNSSAAPASDLDVSGISEGISEEPRTMSSFLQELEEASNEGYKSEEDPDYKPTDSTTEDDSSFVTDGSNASVYSASGDDSFAAATAAAATLALAVEATSSTSMLNTSGGCEEAEAYKTPDEEEREQQF